MPFHVTEPHPSYNKDQTTYIHAGRGGAGNYARYKTKDLTSGPTATGPASATKLPPPPTTSLFTTGRGGAGNTFRLRPESPRRIFSFDEELARDQALMSNAAKAPVYRIGRGGAGNMVNEAAALPGVERRNSTWSNAAASDLSRTVSNESSNSSVPSERDGGKRDRGLVGTLSRIGRTLSRN